MIDKLENDMKFTLPSRVDIFFKLSNMRRIKGKLLEIDEVHFDFTVIRGDASSGSITESKALELINSGYWKQV